MKRKLKVLLILSLTIYSSYSQKLDWEKSFGGKQSDYLLDAIPTADYGFILAGSSVSDKSGNKTSKNNGDLDYWIWKMDERGNMDWEKSFGGSGRDLLYSILHTSDGGFILGGSSDSEKQTGVKESYCMGQEDYWVIKLNARGDVQWEKTLGGRGQDVLVKVISAKDGGYLLCGSSSSGKSEQKEKDSNGGMDFWVVKIDSKGRSEWERTLGGKYDDVLHTAIITTDGNYILGGSTNSPASEDKRTDNLTGDFWIVKLDQAGGVIWERTYGGEGSDDLSALVSTRDGNYIAGGNTNSSYAENGTDAWLLKFDENGEVVWQQSYNVGSMDLLSSLLENKDGSLIAGINSKGISSKKKKKEGVDDFILVKFSPEGNDLWMKNYGSTGRDILRKAISTRDGGYLMAGMSNSPKASRDRNGPIGRTDFWIVKIVDEDKKKEAKLSIEAFPNPVDSYTNIIVGYEYAKGVAIVYDLGGRMIQEHDITGDRTVPINLSGLPVGVYIVQIKTNVQQDGIKIVKK